MVPTLEKTIVLYVIGPRGFPNVQGGIERFSESLYPRLAADFGYRISVLTMRHHTFLREWKGVKMVAIPTVNTPQLEKTIYNFLASIRVIWSRPDIVHIHSIASGLFIFLIKIFRINVVARYNSQDYLHHKWGLLGRLLLKVSERQFLLADHIVVNNPTYLQHFAQLGRTEKITYIPNGVDKPIDPRPLNHFSDFAMLVERNYVLFVGRLTVDKDISTLITAFSLLGRKDALLVIVGDNTEGTVLPDSSTLKDHIIFLGKRNRDELSTLYANCSVFVNPSISEGMPNAVLEALSFRCKVLLSDISGHRQFQLAEDCYFPVGDSTGLSQALAVCLTNENRPDYDHLIRKFAWSEIVKNFDRVNRLVLHEEH